MLIAPWVALLPGLDSTVMGWKERAWFLGGHQHALFDVNGNAGPTVWCNGRIVGGWAHRLHRFMVRGFERAPFLFEPRNPPYYPRLFEANGFAPVHRWYSYEISRAEGVGSTTCFFSLSASLCGFSPSSSFRSSSRTCSGLGKNRMATFGTRSALERSLT